MQLEAADWSIQATPPVHLQGFTPHLALILTASILPFTLRRPRQKGCF